MNSDDYVWRSGVGRRGLNPNRVRFLDPTFDGHPPNATPGHINWRAWAETAQTALREKAEYAAIQLAKILEAESCNTWNKLRRKWASKHGQ